MVRIEFAFQPRTIVFNILPELSHRLPLPEWYLVKHAGNEAAGLVIGSYVPLEILAVGLLGLTH